MQQLDLFGFPIETPAPKKKEKAPAAKAVTVIAPAEPKHEEQEEVKAVAITPAPVEAPADAAQEELIPVAETKPEPKAISLEAIRAQLAAQNSQRVAVETVAEQAQETPAPKEEIVPAPVIEETTLPVAEIHAVVAVEETPDTVSFEETIKPVTEPAVAVEEASPAVEETPAAVAVQENKVTAPETVSPIVEEPTTEIVATAAPEKKMAPAKEKSAVAKTAAPVKQAGKRGRKSFKEMDSEADLVEVPDDETLQKKLYYSISEVAGWFKVNTSLLRYWENEFDVLQPRKTRKGDRLFRVEDVKNLQLIYFLLRQRKFSIDGAKNYLKNNRQEADTQIKLVESLTRFRSFLLEMKATLQA